ncbi:hypothetical protein [Ectopseudomonas alcaliphila]|uniref:Uncharacterized protein n=1 Tax=Ectopseudomonas alcaliphila TaxID=101564 RepID=A0ABU4Q011_9GAMM|nr:hypothetical protein [Pseudomonas alcaliphila]MDX5993494.1 hypothetical protein [Pseudomonas alcaliphila]
MQKFVEILRKDKGHEKENLWFEKCRREKAPFITLKTRTKFADVHWDYITYPNEVDQHLATHKESTTKKAIEIFMRHANEKSEYQVSSGLVYFNNLEIQNAKIAAEELYDLVVDTVSSCPAVAKT